MFITALVERDKPRNQLRSPATEECIKKEEGCSLQENEGNRRYLVGKLILYQKDNMVPRLYTDTYNHAHVCSMKAEKKLFTGTGGTKGRKKRSNKNMRVEASHTGGSVYIYLSQMGLVQSWEQSLGRVRKPSGVISLCTWDEAHTSYQAPSASYSTLFLTFLLAF